MKKFILLFLTAATSFGAVTNTVPVSTLPTASTAASGDAVVLYHNTGSAYQAQRLSVPNFQASSGFVQPAQITTLGTFTTNNFTLVRTNFFNVKNFGAFGDGKVCSHVTISGINLSSPDGSWSGADVGDVIQVMAAGGKGHSLFTTIATVSSSTAITLSQPSTVNFSDQYYCVYGQHDDSSAIQSALNACVANGGGKVYLPPGVYLISTNFVNINQNNAQLIVPQFSSGSGSTMGVSALVEIYGDHTLRTWGGDGTYGLEIPKDSTVMVCMKQGNDNTSTNFLGSSCFDCRPYNIPVLAYSYGVARWPDNDVCVQIHDLAVITGYSPHLAAINLIGAADGSGCENVWVMGGNDAGPAFWTNAPDGTNDYGIIMPGNFQGTYGFLKYCLVSGYQNGYEAGLMQAWDCTANLCSNAVDAYLTSAANLVAYKHGNVSDCPIIFNARGNSACGESLDFDFASIQATIVGESGWWTNLGQIYAIYDPNGHLTCTPGQYELYTTNCGLPVVFLGGSAVFETYPSLVNGIYQKIVLNPMNFASGALHSSGGGIGWDYTVSNLWDQSDLYVSGTLIASNVFEADGSGFNINVILPHFIQTSDAFKFSGSGAYGAIMYWGTTVSAEQNWNFQDGNNDNWNFSYNGVQSTPLGVLGNHPLAWQAPNGQGFGGMTNGTFVGTAGFGSTGTNLLTLGAKGCTNNFSCNVQVIFEAENAWLSNGAEGFTEQLQNNQTYSLELQPGDAIIGNAMTPTVNRAF